MTPFRCAVTPQRLPVQSVHTPRLQPPALHCNYAKLAGACAALGCKLAFNIVPGLRSTVPSWLLTTCCRVVACL
jgi:hypothetical protein